MWYRSGGSSSGRMDRSRRRRDSEEDSSHYGSGKSEKGVGRRERRGESLTSEIHSRRYSKEKISGSYGDRRRRGHSEGGFDTDQSSDSEGEARFKGNAKRGQKSRDLDKHERSSGGRRRGRNYRSRKMTPPPDRSEGEISSSDDDKGENQLTKRVKVVVPSTAEETSDDSPPAKRYKRSKDPRDSKASWKIDEKKKKKHKKVKKAKRDSDSNRSQALIRVAPPRSPNTPPVPPPQSPHTPTQPALGSPNTPPSRPTKEAMGKINEPDGGTQDKSKRGHSKGGPENREKYLQKNCDKKGASFFAQLVRERHGPRPKQDLRSSLPLNPLNSQNAMTPPKAVEVVLDASEPPPPKDNTQSLQGLLKLPFPPGPDKWMESNLQKMSALLMPPPPAPASIRRSARPRIPGNYKVSIDPGQRSIDSYQLTTQIGEGTFGKVFKAKDKVTGEQVAMKKMRMYNYLEGFPLSVVREIKILRQLNHRNIVNLKEVITATSNIKEYGKSDGSCYLVFEYVQHDLLGLLASGLVTFTEEHNASIMKQLLDGVAYCHKNKFMHRDIKPGNILITTKFEVKLADFGLARTWDPTTRRPYTNNVITLWYRPPEILLGLESYTPAVDVWSCGCILGELFLKKAIMKACNELGQLDVIADLCGSPDPEVWPGVVKLPLWRTIQLNKPEKRRIKEKFADIMPPPAIDLLDKMLILDPEKRISADKAMESDWLDCVNPSAIPPPQLPTLQHCHELWAQNRHRKREALSRTEQVEGPSPIPIQEVRYPIPAIYKYQYS